MPNMFEHKKIRGATNQTITITFTQPAFWITGGMPQLRCFLQQKTMDCGDPNT